MNITPSNYNGGTEFLMSPLSKLLIPFNKSLQRKPLDNINRAVTNDSIIYDNIDKYYQKYSKYQR